MNPAPQDPVRRAHEWLVATSPTVLHQRSGRRVGVGLAEELERRVVELRHLDDTVSSAELEPVITKELGEVTSLVSSASFIEPVGRRLFTVLGELAQLAGWVASDAGNFARAENHYLDGVAAAESAADRMLGAQLLSSLSYQLANLDRTADAMLLARTAVTGARDATPVVRALFLERLAWSAAKAGNAESTWRALDAVDDVYEQRGIDEPKWVYWLNRNEIDVMAGRCLIVLGRPADAAPLLEAALARYPHEHAREVALYRSWLAESYARSGNLDAARDMLTRAQQHGSVMPSARTDTRVAEVDRLLPS